MEQQTEYDDVQELSNRRFGRGIMFGVMLVAACWASVLVCTTFYRDVWNMIKYSDFLRWLWL